MTTNDAAAHNALLDLLDGADGFSEQQKRYVRTATTSTVIIHSHSTVLVWDNDRTRSPCFNIFVMISIYQMDAAYDSILLPCVQHPFEGMDSETDKDEVQGRKDILPTVPEKVLLRSRSEMGRKI